MRAWSYYGVLSTFTASPGFSNPLRVCVIRIRLILGSNFPGALPIDILVVIQPFVLQVLLLENQLLEQVSVADIYRLPEVSGSCWPVPNIATHASDIIESFLGEEVAPLVIEG